LERLLKVKERQKEEAMHIEDTQRLVTEEIEMLQVVYYLVGSRKEEDKIIAPRSLSVKSSLSKKEKGGKGSLFILSWWCRA
jgi:hypothetical protein